MKWQAINEQAKKAKRPFVCFEATKNGKRFVVQATYDQYYDEWEDMAEHFIRGKAVAWVATIPPPTPEDLEAINGNAETCGEKGR